MGVLRHNVKIRYVRQVWESCRTDRQDRLYEQGARPRGGARCFSKRLARLQAEGYTIIGHGHDMRRLCETAEPPIRCIDGYFALDTAFPTARPKTHDGSLSMGILVPGLLALPKVTSTEPSPTASAPAGSTPRSMTPLPRAAPSSEAGKLERVDFTPIARGCYLPP